MALPLVTSVGAAGASASATFLAVAVVAGFVAHEPLLVLLGRRGGRAKRDGQQRAIAWLGATAALAVGAALAGAWSMPSHARWSLGLPFVPAVVLGAAILANREKSSLAQLTVALAFSLAAVPVCLASGASTRVGMTVAAVFGVVFVGGTLAVRSIVVATRGGGNRGTARALRVAALLFAGVAGTAFAVAGDRGLLPWAALLAAAPGLAATLWIACVPPAPARLRVVGWTLVAVSIAAALILTVSLSGES